MELNAEGLSPKDIGARLFVSRNSEARLKLAILLEQAENVGKVLIRRKDGQTFALMPEKMAASPWMFRQSKQISRQKKLLISSGTEEKDRADCRKYCEIH